MSDKVIVYLLCVFVFWVFAEQLLCVSVHMLALCGCSGYGNMWQQLLALC